MKKVGIITLNGYFNYGNRLQNYALHETLIDLGFSAETIIIDRKSNSKKKSKISKLKKLTLKEIILFSYIKFKNIYIGRKNKQYLNARLENFKKFTRNHIPETPYCITENQIPNDLIEKYEYFVTGSDQVWNPMYINHMSLYFLTFAPTNKRVAYAPSFGRASIPAEDVNKYKKWLKEMKSISVREEAGSKLISELVNREAPVVIDPTMLVTKEKWISVSKKALQKPSTPYLLTYFLGEISEETTRVVKKIAIDNGLEIVNLATLKDKKYYSAGPDEFIDYINSTSVFFTDSFHGAVFSILLEKPFVVFTREGNTPSMNSRIETLVSKFKFENRLIENINDESEFLNMDFSHVLPILSRERQKSILYLQKALS